MMRLAVPVLVAASCLLVPGAARAAPDQVCAAGAAILRDLPAGLGRQFPNEHRIALDMPRVTSLFERCPDLRRSLPPGFAVATAHEAQVARLGGPPTGERAGAWSIAAPVISKNAAAAAITFDCTGPCGAAWTVRYHRHRGVWARDGEPRVERVS